MMTTLQQFDHLRETLESTRQLEPAIEAVKSLICARLAEGRTVYSAGNGGSAADALHLTEELTGRYSKNRRPLPGVCLNADPTALTCIANEFGFEAVFARPLTALARPGDLFFAITTSGNSPNIIQAVEAAQRREVETILLGGRDGGALRGRCDHELIVPSDSVPRIQEMHTFLIHVLLEAVDAAFD